MLDYHYLYMPYIGIYSAIYATTSSQSAMEVSYSTFITPGDWCKGLALALDILVLKKL